MREELKQREAELEKSFEDKQQLKNQVQNLKEGLQNLQNAHAMQVGLTEKHKVENLPFSLVVFSLSKSSFLGCSLCLKVNTI